MPPYCRPLLLPHDVGPMPAALPTVRISPPHCPLWVPLGRAMLLHPFMLCLEQHVDVPMNKTHVFLLHPLAWGTPFKSLRES